MNLFALGVYFLIAFEAHAFDVLPEYQSLDEMEQSALDRPELIDAEYQTSVWSYQLPFEWRLANEDNEFIGSIGSISSQYFFLHEVVKITKQFVPGLDFKFTHFIQGDFDVDQERNVLELKKSLVRGIAASIYGEGSRTKRENDLGLAFYIDPSAQANIRSFITFNDVVRNDHNDRNDRFPSNRKPISYGFTAYQGLAKLSLRYGLRFDTPTDWNLPFASERYSYQKKLGFLHTKLEYSETENLLFSFQADEKREQKVIATRNSIQTTRFLAQTEWQKQFTPRIFLRPGFGYASRNWRTNTSNSLAHVTDQNLTPMFKVGYKIGSGESYKQVVGELYANAFDRDSTFPQAASTASTQWRMNTRFEWNFSKTASLGLLLSADPDDSFSFEGGNGQIKVIF